MSERDPDFVYVTYIGASREKVWAALTDRGVRPWWDDTVIDTTFKPGEPLTFRRRGKVDVRGVIKEIDPPNKLVHTFHIEGPGPMHDEGETQVTYELVQDGDATKLTVLHTGFVKDSKLRQAVSGGWPPILSALKTTLESGKALAYATWAERAKKSA
ncbi:MAG TPA: SRPBCC family protein [Caulobacterales bacterium]|nr:SRPBCC family protein [Caulobacterales bacterium]